MGDLVRLTAIDGGRTAADSARDIRLTIEEHVLPACAELERMADAGDLEAVRVLCFELLAVTGTIIAACPRPKRVSPR